MLNRLNRYRSIVQFYFFLKLSRSWPNCGYTFKKRFEVRAVSTWLPPLMTYLRFHSGALFGLIVDLVVYDRPGCYARFSLVYVLRSIKYRSLIFVRTQTSEFLPVASLTSVFFGLAWLEREAFDMFGVMFLHHSDLRRILCDYGFRGYPLRKDFPLVGFKAFFFTAIAHRIAPAPVTLSQLITRSFRFKSYGSFQRAYGSIIGYSIKNRFNV